MLDDANALSLASHLLKSLEKQGEHIELVLRESKTIGQNMAVYRPKPKAAQVKEAA